MIRQEESQISITRQCELLDMSRSSLYYQPRPVSEEDHLLMRLIDEQFTRTPFYGKRRMAAFLKRIGFEIGPKKVRSLMELMGLEAIYPKPRLSLGNKNHKKYPYLLKDVVIDRPGKVLSADITYIRLEKGFVYLVAIIDWFSRYVPSWKVSTLLDSQFCVEALEETLKQLTPEIFNTDQGVQFTSSCFTGVLEKQKIAISMDGKGRALDNIFVERLWRSVKYEEVYTKDYKTVKEAEEGLKEYFEFYNKTRLHQSLSYKTPYEVHFGLTAGPEKRVF